MIIKQLSRDTAEAIFVNAQNTMGAKLSVGQFVCWDARNSTSFGVGVIRPETSTLTLFAGIVAHKQPSYADWPANSYGLVQVYGVHGSVAYSVANTSVSCMGDWLGPVPAKYSGGAFMVINNTYYSAGLLAPRGAYLMENDLSAKGWAYAFVRAM